jgi:hypothetical protein
MMNLHDSIKFNNAAFKHGVTTADIFSAFETYIFEESVEGEDNKFLLIGFDTKVLPVEVMYNRIDEERINVFHANLNFVRLNSRTLLSNITCYAMPLRSAYAALLER